MSEWSPVAVAEDGAEADARVDPETVVRQPRYQVLISIQAHAWFRAGEVAAVGQERAGPAGGADGLGRGHRPGTGAGVEEQRPGGIGGHEVRLTVAVEVAATVTGGRCARLADEDRR